MELKSKDLAKALNMASIVIERRNTIPILSHVKIEHTGADDMTRFRATNLDQELAIQAPAVNGAPLSACFNQPDALARLILAGQGETTVIEQKKEDRKAMLRAGQLAGEVSTLPVDDYPTITHAMSVAFEAELGADAIDMLFRVMGAVSAEETRYYLNGLYFHHVEGWTYRAVCTDGHRLYMGTIELPNAQGMHFDGKGKDGGVIIPRLAMRQLARLRSFAKKDAPIRFAVGSKSDNGAPSLTEPAKGLPLARFVIDAHGFPAELTTKTIDGTFPDYTRVVPDYDDSKPQVVFRRADLRRALDGITAGMTGRTRAVKLIFDPKGKLTVAAKWVDMGFEGKIEIDAKTRTPQGAFEVGFNGAYLRNLLDASRGEELVITTDTDASPGSIVDPAAHDFRAVLMPMRV